MLQTSAVDTVALSCRRMMNPARISTGAPDASGGGTTIGRVVGAIGDPDIASSRSLHVS